MDSTKRSHHYKRVYNRSSTARSDRSDNRTWHEVHKSFHIQYKAA